jgi:hypothetical protein
MTENEIAAAALADQGRVFNPQQQFPVTWPAHPVVALAYLDQLQRAGAVSAADVAGLRGALAAARADVDAKRRNPALASQIDGFAKELKMPANSREAALRKTLTGIAGQLR